jgi:hypothetical protein
MPVITPHRGSAARQEVVAQGAFQIKEIPKGRAESSRDCFELRYIRWQQLATDCLFG